MTDQGFTVYANTHPLYLLLAERWKQHVPPKDWQHWPYSHGAKNQEITINMYTFLYQCTYHIYLLLHRIVAIEHFNTFYITVINTCGDGEK
jgi:hypothetical protein